MTGAAIRPAVAHTDELSRPPRTVRFSILNVSVALGLALVGVALALRLALLIRSNWLLEGDDALSTLMAFDVLAGQWPIMLKNQTYAAAWEPYAMAVSYALFGASRESAKLPALLGSLGLIGVTWLLARQVAGAVAAWFAALLAAVPPVYVLVLGLKPWAPYTEVIIFGSLALLCAVRLGWPPDGQHDGRWAAACGLCGGIAFWMHPLAVWYLSAALVVLALTVRGRRWLVIGSSGVAGFLVGALPVWIFNLQTGGSTLQFILGGTRGQTADRLAVLSAWWSMDLPRGAGLWHPWGESSATAGIVMAACLVAALVWAVFVRRRPRPRPLDALLVLLLLIPLLFVGSGFGGPALNPYGFDATGRYAPSIWYALAVVGGAALAAVWRVRAWAAVLLALLPIGVNLVGYAAIDPLQAFQSPYWPRLPASNAALLTALRERGISAVWINHWAGQPLMFDARSAGQPLVAYDWYDVHGGGGIDRFPEFRAVLDQAERPAFVLVTDEAEPELVRQLRALGVAFEVVRVPPYVIVVPTSRRVDPSEVGSALDYRY